MNAAYGPLRLQKVKRSHGNYAITQDAIPRMSQPTPWS